MEPPAKRVGADHLSTFDALLANVARVTACQKSDLLSPAEMISTITEDCSNVPRTDKGG